jgi:hypothetical protein
MKLAELQAKLNSMRITAPTSGPHTSLTEADKIAIAQFHYNYFRSPPPTLKRAEDLATFEVLKRHAQAECGRYYPREEVVG